MVHLIAVDLPSLYVRRYEVDERLYGTTKAKCRSGEAWTKIRLYWQIRTSGSHPLGDSLGLRKGQMWITEIGTLGEFRYTFPHSFFDDKSLRHDCCYSPVSPFSSSVRSRR